MNALDCHAHVAANISPVKLDRLGACIVAVTHSPAEYTHVQERNDRSTAWALGAHPGVPDVHDGFDAALFRTLLMDTPIIGEIGLDGRSKVRMDSQRRTFDEILAALKERPRVASVHSVAATASVLDAIQAHKPVGIILHWWRGTKQETRKAVELGCYFSINAAEVDNPRVLDFLPCDRVLTETDHPFGDRQQQGPRHPGRVTQVEAALAIRWELSVNATRRMIWTNFRRLALQTKTADLFPEDFQKAMLATN